MERALRARFGHGSQGPIKRIALAALLAALACLGCDPEAILTPPDSRPTDNLSVTGDSFGADPEQTGAIDPASLRVKSATPFCCDPFERILEASFGDDGIPTGGTCAWEFGDGASAQGCLVRHRFARPGTYEVAVDVSLPDGLVAHADAVIEIGFEDGPSNPNGSDDVDPSGPGGATPGDDSSVPNDAGDPSDGGTAQDDPINPSGGDVEILLSADAGPDVQTTAGAEVQLHGVVHAQPAAPDVVVHWEQSAGPTVAIVGGDTTTPSFTAPILSTDSFLDFSFTVTAHGQEATDSVTVSVPRATPAQLVALHGYARADWWDFDPADATDAVQGAIDSGAESVIIPDIGQPWVVRPLTLRSDIELTLEPNVILAAKPGAFHGLYDNLLAGDDVSNVVIIGYGATIRMRKQDYTSGGYAPSEWRHGIALRGVADVHIDGLRVENTGGDGFYIGSSLLPGRVPSRNVHVQNCTSADNYRQGMSIVSGRHVLIEQCLIERTEGTPPQAAIDLEPSFPNDELVDVEIRDCVANDNAGSGLLVNLSKLDQTSAPVSIRIVNFLVRLSRAAALRVVQHVDNGASGTVEFVDCTVEDNHFAAVMFDWALDSAVQVSFLNCLWTNVALRDDQPLLHFALAGHNDAPPGGGITFTDVQMFMPQPRLVVQVVPNDNGPFPAVSGVISLYGVEPDGTEMADLEVLPNLSILYHGEFP